MALTKAAANTTHGSDSYGRFTVVSGTTIYKGAIVAYLAGTGTVTNYDDVAGHIPLGYAQEKVVGDGSLRIQVRLAGDVIRDQSITGVSDETTNGRAVYATDEATFTLTRPADDAHVVGVVLDGDSSNADLLMLSIQDYHVLGLAGGNKRTIFLGTIHTTALEGTSGVNLRTSFPLWGHGIITDFFAYPTGFDSGHSAGSQTLNLEIGGTDLTGGILTLAGTSLDAIGDVGTKISATAITAANEFHDGDVLDVELVSGGTGFVASIDLAGFNLFADVEYRAGA